jgi:hypothetical protein
LAVACEDTETQRNGIVLVMWGIGEGIQSPKRSDYTSEFGVTTIPISVTMEAGAYIMFLPVCTEARQLFDSMPVRIACVHQCFDDTPLFQFYRGMTVMMMNGTNNKMRLQTHVGRSSCEIRYRLLGYGIPVDCTCTTLEIHISI